MIHQYVLNHKFYQYAIGVDNGEYEVGKYVRKEIEKFLTDINNPDCPYFFDYDEAEKITNLTKLINMATGHKAGTPSHDALGGFQWYFILNALCWKHKDDHSKRRYEKSVLLIARKSGKSFLIGLLFIILLLIEPEYSEFYSVAPDKELSSIIKKEVEQTIDKSPYLQKYFKIVDKEIRCTLTKSKYVPLANSHNRMDGRKANVYVADEVGALRNSYPIEAMQSSQMNMVNRTGILISTAYESINNPMIDEVSYAEKVLDGIVEDETLFSLLYKPDDPKDWTSNKTIYQSNPIVYDVPQNLDYLFQQRKRAIEMPSAIKNYKTKHLNIFVEGNDTELFINNDDLKQGRLDGYDWKGKEVYLGVDLSQTTDNTSITMLTYDNNLGKYVAKSWAFIPEGRAEEKSKLEKIDYFLYQEQGYCFLVGDRVIDYSIVEEFVFDIENKYGVDVIGVGYDRYNAISSVNKWKDKYLTIEVEQHSRTLHPATKLLQERILNGEFLYDKNRLYEDNFSNAKTVLDTNNNKYISKKKSNGKIDMVASTLNAMYLWYLRIELNDQAYEDRGVITI